MREGGSLNNLEDDSNIMLFYSLKELFNHNVSANFVADCSNRVVVIIRVDNNTITYFLRRLTRKCNVSHRQNQKN